MKRLLCILLLLSVFIPLIAYAENAEEETSLQEKVDKLLQTIAEAEKDPWAKAILEDGAQDISGDGSAISFMLRSYNPDLRSLGAYAKADDRQAWLRSALENASAYDLPVRISLKDGNPDKRAAGVVKKAVKKAAATAKTGVNSKDFSAALGDLFFCAPYAQAKKGVPDESGQITDEFSAFIAAHPEIWSCDDPAEWAPLFLLQGKPTVSVKNGPYDLLMTWTGYTPRQLLNDAYNSSVEYLSSITAEKRATGDALRSFWRGQIVDAASAAVRKKGTKNTVHVSVAELAEGKYPNDYVNYMKTFDGEEDLQRLSEGLSKLPEEASQSMPKHGVITSAKKGRTVTIRVPKGGVPAYVQLRDADTDVIQAEAFIMPGKNVRVKVPEGTYTVQYASGTSWYGNESLFGPLGTYRASNDFDIGKKPWKLVAGEDQEGITLSAITTDRFAAVEDRSVRVAGQLESPVVLAESYPDNPVISGVSSITGLPSSGEAYTPVLMVLDNAEDGYPHWGVSDADIIFQVPNAGSGVTKLMALFTDRYPEAAGPVRSGRASMIPAAKAFNAAFAYAGPPMIKVGNNVALDTVLTNMSMYKEKKVYNLLRGGYSEKIKGLTNGHGTSCKIAKIHNNLQETNIAFEERPFLFTDEKRTDGVGADIIKVLHRGEKSTSASNSASRAVFNYDPDKNAYTRTNSSGVYRDRNTDETVMFANVIVVRVKFDWEYNFVYLHKNLTGSGCADIFQCGRYVQGAWLRKSEDSRLVFVDADGSELKLQRGKTFIVLTNEITDIIYSVR